MTKPFDPASGLPSLARPGDSASNGLIVPPVLGLNSLPEAGAILPAAAPNALSLLLALRRRYKLAIGIGPILGGLVAVGAWFLIPHSKYMARALLQVSSSQPKVIFKTEENRVDFATYQKTQLTLIKSRGVLNQVLSDPAVGKLPTVRDQLDPIPWLEKRIQADYLGEVLRISMSGNQPEELATLVNAVADAYRKVIVEDESKERWMRHDELKKIYDEYQGKLEKRRGELRKLTQRVGSKDKQTIRYAQELSIERLSTARGELVQIQSDLRKAKAELEIRLAQGQRGVEEKAVAEAEVRQLIDSDPQVVKLKAKIADLESSLGRAERVARDRSDPSVKTNLDLLATTRKRLDSAVAAIRPRAIEQLARAKPNGEISSVQGLRDRIEVLEELERVTQAIFDAQSAETQEISQDTFYIDAIQDEIGHADNAAKRIGEELETLSVELRAPSRVRQLERADAPRKEDDKRVVLAGGAGLSTCALFLVAVAFAEFRARRIGSIDEVTHGVGLRVVGSLPPIRKRIGRGLLGAWGANSTDSALLIESVDSIRTMLLHSTGDRSLRSIMVTSATGGEGKTSLACHLATSLARSGMKTLLIDCDLRKPTIHRLYDMPATPGFSEYLRGDASAHEVIRATEPHGPSIVTAGACDARTLRALAQDNSESIFDVLGRSYDIMIVDTSPILPVTDGLLVGRHVDAAVYSILRDVSRLPWTLAAIGRLRSLNIRILGAVVTGVRPQPYGTYYTKAYSTGVHHA